MTETCIEEGCDLPIHSRERCQKHYRRFMRRERGLGKPGPAPDASKPFSRHNPRGNKQNRGVKHLNVLGGSCQRGHPLEGHNAKKEADGGISCRTCGQDNRRAARGLSRLDYLIDGRSLQQKLTHCKRGHEFIEGSYYSSIDADGYEKRACKACEQLNARKRRYDLTPEQFANMFEEQGARCALCRVEFFLDARDKPVVDHDHETNEVRGLLCPPCNKGLGLLGDSIEKIERALAYVRGGSRVP